VHGVYGLLHTGIQSRKVIAILIHSGRKIILIHQKSKLLKKLNKEGCEGGAMAWPAGEVVVQ
jgi:hypothetical protein